MQQLHKNYGKKIGSIIITFILISLILFVLFPPATSVNLTTGYPFGNNEVIFGNTITFENVNLTIRGEEKIPVTLLNFSIYNESGDFIESVEFNVQGNELNELNNFTVNLVSTIHSSWNEYGYGYGYDEPEGPGYYFGYGYGYGYGYGDAAASDITFLYDITYNITQSGTYYAQFFVNSTSTAESHLFDSETSANFIIEEYTLYKGWNLITMAANSTINASHLASNISGCEMVSWFDAEDQSYKTYVNGSSAYDFQLISGYGLFVYMNQNLSLNISGAEITSVSVPLESGWDMIGWYKETETNASNIQSAITNCSQVSWYNTSKDPKGFTTYTGPGSNNFPIERGLGLFVYVNESSIWLGEG
ncbi:MAG: hypothetical protein R6V50_08330 [Thermoplasmatota archaeon]